MHYKRPKTKRRVRCTLCTPHRWQGNNKNRFKTKEEAASRDDKKEIRRLLNYNRIGIGNI
jgi:hypothetical protein